MHPILGCVIAMHAISVSLPGPATLQISVPDRIGTFGKEMRLCLISGSVEQAEFNALGDGREYGEIGARGIRGSTQRSRASGCDHWPMSLIGSTFQISSLYSRIVRSVENLPDDAVFRMLIFVQRSSSSNAWPAVD